MRREIYLDGERFTTMLDALAYLYKRGGARVSYALLRRAADREDVLAIGKGEEVRVSWKQEEPARAKQEEPVRVFRRPPLLRYPPGEGPRYDWSRRWR
jgi:hypothetical protein